MASIMQAPSQHNSSVSTEPLGDSPKISVSNLNFHYGSFHALKAVSMRLYEKRVTALIGPSASGKSTFLRTLNRLNEMVRNSRVLGELLLDGENALQMDVVKLRKKVGMVFQKPNPFPKSIFDNVAFGPRINGYSKRAALRALVEHSLRRAALWDEVKDRIHKSAYGLSLGQQQRLCIARALAVNPEVLLLDEPCSALDPISTAKIEDLISSLKSSCTILIATHNTQQAARIADYTGLLVMGRLIEFDTTRSIFNKELAPDSRILEYSRLIADGATVNGVQFREAPKK